MPDNKNFKLSNYIQGNVDKPLSVYIHSLASSPGRYALEQGVQALCGWIPTIAGIGIRAALYSFLISSKSTGTLLVEAGSDIRYFNRISAGKRVYIDRNVRMHASPAGIELGNDVKIFFGSYLCTFTSDMVEGEGIHIGNSCWIGIQTVLHGGKGGIWLGDRTLIAPHVNIICGNHKLDRSPDDINAYEQLPVRIGTDCWLGAGCTVVGGVTLGNNVTVAAGAVVTQSFGNNVLIGGIPARILKEF